MKFITLAHLTFSELIRRPSPLVLLCLMTILMLLSPSFSSFALGQADNLFRTNLLSSLMLGGIIYISSASSSAFEKDIRSKTILTLLSAPVSIPLYYLGKLTGIFMALAVFFFTATCIGLLCLSIGGIEATGAKANWWPTASLPLLFLILFLGSAVVNYLADYNMIAMTTLALFFACPTLLLLIEWICPLFSFHVADGETLWEFSKASILLLALLMVIGAFSVAIGSFTGAVLNFILCLSFLCLGLMAPGLHSATSSSSPVFSKLISCFPDLHTFWMGDALSLGHSLPMMYLFQSSVFGAFLVAGFSAIGIFILSGRDYS